MSQESAERGNSCVDNIMLEHSFRTSYKIKGQALLKMIPGRGWVKLRELQNRLLAKVVQTLDESAYVIGGALDRESK